MSSFTRTTGTRRRLTAPPAAAAHPPGMVVLGRYRLHRPLGAGGFGSVWKARDERLERDVAVKILARERILDGRFEREARATARLCHPGIVTLYEAAVDDHAAYLVSELVHGSTLGQLLQAGRLSDRDIVEIGIALSEALSHAHAQGVVHRDVKPSNVLVPEQPGSWGQVARLADFGVARLIDADTLTRTGEVIGTAAYMAPEQADGREAGAAADLYSLALVLYEALTGLNPLALGTPAQRARRLGAHLPPLRRHRRELPGDLGQTLDQALRPRPRERGTIDELHANLVRCLDQVADLPGVVTSAWRRPRTAGAAVAVLQPDEASPAPDEAEPPAPASERAGWWSRLLTGAAAGGGAAWLVGFLSPAPRMVVAVAGLVVAAAVALLPRVGWLTLTMALGGLLVARGVAGAAVVVVLSAMLPVALMPRQGTNWPLGVLAAGLGAISLAGGWPALAGRASSPWNRAALGAVGWVWVLSGGLLAGHGLYAALPQGLPADWPHSLSLTIDHVVPRQFTPALLAPALVWGVASMVLPWLMPRWLAARVIVVTVWSAALASATATTIRLTGSGVMPRPGVVVLGALLAWILALAPSFIRWGERARRSTNTGPRLA